MKVLLVAINAKYIHSNLAVHSLAEYASGYSDMVEVAEYTINNQMDKIVMDIFEKKPDVVMFSGYIWNIDEVKDVASKLYKIRPELDIWFGGPEVSFDGPEVIENNKYLKGIIIGEGEQCFVELLEHYCDKERELKDICGIMYRDKDSVTITNPRILLDMNNIPFVYDDLTPYNNKIIYYESSRGCPFSCSYCMSSIDKTVRFRDIEIVKKDLKHFLVNNIRQVKFVDRTFNIQEKRTMEILEFIRDNDNGITNFHFEVAADLISDDEIQLMQQLRPGLIQLEIGVQSTNEETIKMIDRKMDFNKVAQVVEKLRKNNNIHIHLDLIAGLPKEDMTSFIKSFNDVYRQKPHELQLGFLKVLKGSKMHRMSQEYGLVYSDSVPYEVLKTNWISYEDIIRLKRVEDMVEVYFNSGLFGNVIKCLEKYFETPFDLYDGLALYYHNNHLSDINHTRITRYNILMDFIRETCKNDVDVIEQVMVLDLFLKENLKTRPSFAMEESLYKTKTKDIYREYVKEFSGKMFHIEPFSIDVIKFLETGEIEERESLILFDYENRDCISKLAGVREV